MIAADTIGRILVIRVEFVLVGIVICKQADRQVSKAFIKAGKSNYKTSGRADGQARRRWNRRRV